MMFSSGDRVPKPGAEENSMTFAEYRYTGEPYVIHQSIFLFADKPTLKNAKKVLTDYGIHYPLRTKHRNAKNRNIRISKEVGTGGGGDIYNELLVLDMMHDFINYGDPEKNWNVFGKEIELPRELKTAFLSQSYGFTRLAAEHLYKKTGTKLFESGFDVLSKNVFDSVLFKRLGKMKHMNVVLDNIVGAIKTQNGLGEGTIGFLGCAFLLVLFANMKRLGFLENTAEINLLDGAFLELDGNYINRFVVMFLKSIKRITLVQTVYFKSYKPKFVVKMGQTLHEPKSFNRHFKARAHIIVKDDKQFLVFDEKEYEIGVDMPIPKKELYESVMNKRMWLLNFLRDAYKADVAVLEDALYITHDRLAHLYYRLIGGRRGILLHIDGDAQGKSWEYKVSI